MKRVTKDPLEVFARMEIGKVGLPFLFIGWIQVAIGGVAGLAGIYLACLALLNPEVRFGHAVAVIIPRILFSLAAGALEVICGICLRRGTERDRRWALRALIAQQAINPLQLLVVSRQGVALARLLPSLSFSILVGSLLVWAGYSWLNLPLVRSQFKKIDRGHIG